MSSRGVGESLLKEPVFSAASQQVGKPSGTIPMVSINRIVYHPTDFLLCVSAGKLLELCT